MDPMLADTVCQAERSATSLEGRTALVTGASRGIGRGIAAALLAAEASVLVTARGEEQLRRTGEALDPERCLPVVADATNLADMDAAVARARERFGGLDILCHNVGAYPTASIEDMSEDEWAQALRTNLTSAFIAVKVSLPELRRSPHARIVLISSITGPRTGQQGLAHYGAAKAGMLGFMRTAALEFAPFRITVNAIEPGSITTESQRALAGPEGASRLKAIPLGHRGEPRDIGAAVVFLASDGARFITGESLVVDGGQVVPEHV